MACSSLKHVLGMVLLGLLMAFAGVSGAYAGSGGGNGIIPGASAAPTASMASMASWPQPTPEDARAMVQKAAEVLSRDGLEKACQSFQQRNGPFWQGDLYVFVLDFDGLWRCYPPRPDAVGMRLILLQDVDGRFFIQEMVDLAKGGGNGWVEYKWKNPANGQIQLKSTYVHRVGGLLVAAGVFK